MDEKLQGILQRAEGVVGHEDYETLKALFESYAYLAELVQEEDMTMDRLWEKVYGPSNEPPEAEVHEGTNPDMPVGGARVGIGDI